MISLRRFSPDRDGPALHAVLGDEQCCTYMADPATGAVEETISLLMEWTTGTEDTSWAIVDHDDGDALGRVTMIPRGEAVWEAGVMTIPSAQGRGVAYAGLCKALDHVFEKCAARRVYGDIDPDNAASIRLFERLGFQKEGLLRAAWKTHIGVRDSVIMGLIATDRRPWR